jgi:hypothetical protein
MNCRAENSREHEVEVASPKAVHKHKKLALVVPIVVVFELLWEVSYACYCIRQLLVRQTLGSNNLLMMFLLIWTSY